MGIKVGPIHPDTIVCIVWGWVYTYSGLLHLTAVYTAFVNWFQRLADSG